MAVNMEYTYVEGSNEYPELASPTSSRWVSYLREQFVSIQFNLPGTRKTAAIHELYNQLVQVLQLIKKSIHNLEKNQEDYIHMLDIFYRLLFYTRDCRGGNGDRLACYTFIMALYDVYPTLAIYALHLFVLHGHKPISVEPNTPIPHSAIGSWKDIIRICDFLRVYSKQGTDHALVETCIEMIVRQLITDNFTWKFSIRAMNPQYISNVAKWIPREHKKYDWLFTRLVNVWSNQKYPYIVRTAITADSRVKALLKCKRLFRKYVAGLNKHLMTPEIFMTDGKWNAVKPSHIPTSTYLKHFEKLNTLALNESTSAQIPMQCLTNTIESSHRTVWTGYVPSFGTLVKHAIRIINDECSPSEDYHNISRDTLHCMWKRTLNQFEYNAFKMTMPILDVSSSMMQEEPESFYNAIGLAIAIASRSSLPNRIMAVASSPVWIQWKSTDSVIDIVKCVLETISPIQGTFINYHSAIQLVIQGLHGSFSTPRFIDQMHLVIISDFATSFHEVDISPMFTNNLFASAPSMIFWNVSTNTNLTISSEMMKPRNYFLSGGALHALESIIMTGPTTTFDAIVTLVNNPRYLAASTYLRSLCTTSIGT